MNRRTAFTTIPLAIAGLAATAEGAVIPGPSPNHGFLDKRALSYSLCLIVEASRSGISSAFIVFAQHVVDLASTGDCAAVLALAERFTDLLYEEYNHYDETREKWIVEETAHFDDIVDMDDESLSWPRRELALQKADQRHARRCGDA